MFQVVGGGGSMRGGRRGRGCEATGRVGESLSHGASRGFLVLGVYLTIIVFDSDRL